MKQFYLLLILCFTCLIGFSQKSFHVFPKDSKTNPGSTSGDGSLNNPWDLQTALNQKPDKVNGGDTIWLHDGIYTGRFVSKLKSTITGKQIVVSSFNNEWAILNGNIPNPKNVATLSVHGNNVTYQNFEVSARNLEIRTKGITDFIQFGGISHNSGKNCQFINLIIHRNNGLGFGSWNKTGGTIISNCIVYNNGYIDVDGGGRGEGFYVQNDSDDQIRILKNNIIFNNYYKGVEVWSASRNADREWVKNIILDNNVIFNSGLVSNRTVDNIIVATDDRNSINIAKNIKIKNNILYHNTNYSENQVNGDAPSLTIGFYHKSPAENVEVTNNIILGRNNPLRLLYAKNFNITNNIFYGGYIHVLPQSASQLTHSTLDNNKYYTKNRTPFFVNGKKYTFNKWKEVYKSDVNSEYNHLKEFDLPAVLDIEKNPYKENTFRVTAFNKRGNDIMVDFSQFNLPVNSRYEIRDVENFKTLLKKGHLNETYTIVLPMDVERYPSKTLNNFGVYIISFEKPVLSEEENDGFFKSLFRWLGF